MNLKQLGALLLLLALNTSIRSQPSKACDDSSSCVKNRVQDFLITEHIKAKALRIDTSLLLKKIVDLKEVINYQDENARARNLIVTDQNKVINIYKKDNVDLTIKWQKAEKKASNRARTTLVFIGTTILLGTIVVLK